MKNFKKKITVMITVLMTSSIINAIPLDVSAICCRKSGFDKTQYESQLTGNMAEDVATIAKSQKGRTCDQFGYSGIDRGAWCDEYVADCIELAGGNKSIVEHGGDVANFENIMRKKGAKQVYSPKTGDLVFFKFSHVEIVTKVENGEVYCAGGNNGNAPGKCDGEQKVSSMGGARLYLRPNYSAVVRAPKPAVSIVSSTSLKLKWKKEKNAAKYRIERKSPGGEYKVIKTITGTSFTDKGLKANSKYYYRVYSIDKKGNVSAEDPKDLTIPAYTLTSPKPTVSTVSSSSLKLKWKKVSNATEYCIERKDPGSDEYKVIATTKNLTYTDKKLKANSKYSYRVYSIAKSNDVKYQSKDNKVVTGTTSKKK